MRASGRKSINVWGIVTKEGLGPLYRIQGRFCTASYINIVEQVLLPHVLDGPFNDGCFILQQDLSPVHTSRAAKGRLEELGIMTIDWPPQGADMNVIENVWGLMKKNLSKMGLHNVSCDELWRKVEAEWELLKIDHDLVPALYDSLPRRIATVVQSGGAFSKY